MRRAVKKKNKIYPDHKYQSEKVSKFINYVMWDGKKTVAEREVYLTLELVKDKTEAEDPVEILEEAIRNAGPTMEVRSRRVGGANYQVPREVRPERRRTLGMKWIIEAARKKKGSAISKRLADEIIAASQNEGEAVKKRENAHKMAEANKAFAHFAW